MKPYGYTKTGKSKMWDYGFEDVLSIIIGGRKSSIGKLPEKSGEYKSYIRSSKKRKIIRRYWKRCERKNNKINFEKTPNIREYPEVDNP
jgi:hypothetical protein